MLIYYILLFISLIGFVYGLLKLKQGSNYRSIAYCFFLLSFLSGIRILSTGVENGSYYSYFLLNLFLYLQTIYVAIRIAMNKEETASRLNIKISTLIIVLVLGIAIVGIAYRPAQIEIVSVKQQTCGIRLETVGIAIKKFQNRHQRLPKRLQELLEEQIISSEDTVDPWGHEFIYEYSTGRDTFDLLSLGADNKKGGDREDTDISIWDLKDSIINPGYYKKKSR